MARPVCLDQLAERAGLRFRRRRCIGLGGGELGEEFGCALGREDPRAALAVVDIEDPGDGVAVALNAAHPHHRHASPPLA